MTQPSSGSPASLDRTTVFFVGFVVFLLASFMAHSMIGDYIDDLSKQRATRTMESLRLDRIIKQPWWIDKSTELDTQVAKISTHFWSEPTLGIIRANLERHLLKLVRRHKLKVTNIFVDTKVTKTGPINLLEARLKLDGDTKGVIKLLSELENAAKDIFVKQVNWKFYKNRSKTDIIVQVPILLSSNSS